MILQAFKWAFFIMSFLFIFLLFSFSWLRLFQLSFPLRQDEFRDVLLQSQTDPVLHGFRWAFMEHFCGLTSIDMLCLFRLSVTEDSAKMEWRCSLWRRRDTKLCSLESVSLYASSHIVLLTVIWTDKHVHWKDGENLFFSKSLGAPWLPLRVNGCGWSTWQFLPLYQ